MTEEEVLQKLDTFKNAIISLKESLKEEKMQKEDLQSQINILQNRDGDFINQVSEKISELNNLLED